MARQKKIFSILVGLGVLLLMIGIVAACKSKKKSKGSGGSEELWIAAPTTVSLKSPALSPSFVRMPTFTVGGVEEGDTVRLFKSNTCNADSLLGSGVVANGRTSLDITISALGVAGIYPIYANRTNTAGENSSCSAELMTYQLIDCPENYVPVDGNAELGVDEFCVMIMEAKKGENNIPVATYENLSWRNIKPQNAKNACRAITIPNWSCDLISNPQWMTIARDLEANPENWSGAEVGQGVIMQGHSDNKPGSHLSIVDPTDPLDQKSSSAWSQRRIFKLRNGFELWDFAGNAWEWVDWTTGGDTFTLGPHPCNSGGSYIELFNVDCPGLNFDDYMPANPAGIPPEEYGKARGLGSFSGPAVEGDNGAAKRGNFYNSGDYAGIFFLDLWSGSQGMSNHIGFRCVCTLNQ